MTDREKLMELVYAARVHADEECDKYEGCSCCPHDARADMCQNGPIVDHLIANGVVVREWIPVTERLPEPFVSVLVQMPGEEPFPTVREGFISNDGIWHSALYDREPDEVTHWMPLPEPPMRKGENG